MSVKMSTREIVKFINGGPISRHTPAPKHRFASMWTDGSCPANPGPMGIGYWYDVAPCSVNGTGYRVEEGYRLGDGTNNRAEYLALIGGMRSALLHAVSHIRIHCDSLLIVNQVLGSWKCKDHSLKHLQEEAAGLLALFSEATIEHRPREENTLADLLSKNPTDPAALPPEVELDLNPPRSRKMSRFDAARIQYWWRKRICQNEYRLSRLFGVTPSFCGRIGRGEQYKDISESDLRRPR